MAVLSPTSPNRSTSAFGRGGMVNVSGAHKQRSGQMVKGQVTQAVTGQQVAQVVTGKWSKVRWRRYVTRVTYQIQWDTSSGVQIPYVRGGTGYCKGKLFDVKIPWLQKHNTFVTYPTDMSHEHNTSSVTWVCASGPGRSPM